MAGLRLCYDSAMAVLWLCYGCAMAMVVCVAVVGGLSYSQPLAWLGWAGWLGCGVVMAKL